MCEMAALRPEKYGVERITEAAMQLYFSMGTSLGIVAVTANDSKYEYNVFKAMEPEQEAVQGFIEDNHDETGLFIIHGRLATHGERNIDGAHPIEIDCSECDVDYLLHNGIVSGHGVMRRETQETGHEYETKVDSEAIAHKTATVPDDFDQVNEEFEREPCYILLNEDRIFMTTSYGYTLTVNGDLARERRQFAPVGEESYKSVILNAGDDN